MLNLTPSRREVWVVFEADKPNTGSWMSSYYLPHPRTGVPTKLEQVAGTGYNLPGDAVQPDRAAAMLWSDTWLYEEPTAKEQQHLKAQLAALAASARISIKSVKVFLSSISVGRLTVFNTK